MTWNRIHFVLCIAALIYTAQEAGAKRGAKGTALEDKSGEFTAPRRRYAKQESYVVQGDVDGNEKILVELNLEKLGEKEIVTITDYTKDVVNADEEQTFQYTKQKGQLKE